MLKRLSLAIVFFVPTVALALEIVPGSWYSDVKPTSVEAPTVNLLTRAGVVQGIGNSKFGPSRLVKRAEFLKMAIASLPSDLKPPSVQGSCFKDVPEGAWFTPYVCAAKEAGIVKGGPDGLFRPERSVQYDEALKMLTLLYSYDIGEGSGRDWAEPYYDAATKKKVDLSVRIRFATPLTRAYAARLIGAFLAESQGQLQNLRLAEAGRFDLLTPVTSSSTSSSSQSSVASSTSSDSPPPSSSSVSSLSPLFTLPASSHFLLVGKTSDAIASVSIPATTERSFVAKVHVKLMSEARSLQNLELVTTDGTVLATLSRKLDDGTADYKLTFEAQIAAENQKALPKDTTSELVLRATIRPIESSGFSEDLLQVRTMTVTLRGETTNETRSIPTTVGFPKHQTAFGRVTSVIRTSAATDTLRSGSGLLVSSFMLKGASITSKSLYLEQLVFSYQKMGLFSLSLPFIVSGSKTIPCSMSEAEKTITCPGLMNIGTLSETGIPIDLRANFSVPAGIAGASFQVDLLTAGTPETLGSVHWTDETGHFRWIEGASPIVTGTRLQ